MNFVTNVSLSGLLKLALVTNNIDDCAVVEGVDGGSEAGAGVAGLEVIELVALQLHRGVDGVTVGGVAHADEPSQVPRS